MATGTPSRVRMRESESGTEPHSSTPTGEGQGSLGHASSRRAGLKDSQRFAAATTADQPPQGNDAKCGLGCHSIVKARDYMFTDYAKR
jgi:hypothetical protein